MTIKELFRAILADIDKDKEMNHRQNSHRDYLRLFLLPQLACLLIYRLSRYLFLKNFIIFSKLLRTLNVILFSCDIQPEANILGGCFIGHTMGIVIGRQVEIDVGCIIFQGVTITPGTHPGEISSEPESLHIGKRVRIYAGAKIIGNLSIGSDVIIGANSVVLQSVPDGTTVVGIPARPIINTYSHLNR